MKDKINSITVLFICLFLFSGCGKTANVNSSGNLNKAISNTNTAISANTAGNTVTTVAPPVDPKFNAANFNKLETGMKYADVVKILGSKGQVDSNAGLTGGKIVMYKWTDASGAFVKVIFQDDMLLDKVQTGLK